MSNYLAYTLPLLARLLRFCLVVLLTLQTVAHYNDFLKIALQKSLSTYKIVVTVVKKVVVCLDNKYLFCSLGCSVRGPYN